ncbi:gamma-glutamyltranspeptidase / glutathione hydrolase [Roseovarius lutimaris]|uniref:Gamma-glutamyltranspeptidase / glutathione hydrolase n=1 Tax=Roseovarius lutimaris TaxID=1005928 RepID=A0A1I5GX09_9RHOB|nr:gamma-glutamyltransferase family protein [Roseovarius lutimaris]SFO40499.1 gamma-glutamyltranspeptidase / glutathione hydrolase [Roseovarius lutimaris]
MQNFTTRPEIRGTFGVVTSTHWIASAVGMSILEKGGNAFDAAVATGFVLQVVEPHLNGPAGDLPVIFHSVRDDGPGVLCAQGPAPAAATIEAMKTRGIEDLIPGSGLLATVVPGAFDGWLLLLRDHGTMELADVLTPAIGYCADGHPLLASVAETIASMQPFFEKQWPTSAKVWCADGKKPTALSLFKNPDLAKTYGKLVDAAKGDTREARIDAARDEWRTGFVAEAIGNYLKDAKVMDVTGRRNSALLTQDDITAWSAHFEAPTKIDYHGWTLCKTGPWGQGPVLLQALQILKNFDIAAMDPYGAEFVHTVIEAIKLAYADREAYYGDPDFYDVPVDVLLSEEYGRERAKLISDKASLEQRPGVVEGHEHLAEAAIMRALRKMDVLQDAATGEPTMAHLTDVKGDTVHLDIIDRWGNAVSSTPSGGWLQSNPVVPGLGFGLNSRAQMFWLDEGLASSLKPGARPRTTLTPTIAYHKDGTLLSLGSPGGDQQDQWQLVWLLRMVHHGFDMQQGIDAPLFHSTHFQASFYPRAAESGEMMIEETIGKDVIQTLRDRGHEVAVAQANTVGRLTAAKRHPDGQLQAAATPRLMQAYAIGR